MPLFAAWMVLMPVDIASSRAPRSLARLLKPCDVKKLVGLSSAELTRLPVASLVCVDVIRSEVCCRFSRFDRTPAERTISLILGYLPGVGSSIPTASDRTRQHGSAALKQVEQTWLTGRNRYKNLCITVDNVVQASLLSERSQAAFGAQSYAVKSTTAPITFIPEVMSSTLPSASVKVFFARLSTEPSARWTEVGAAARAGCAVALASSSIFLPNSALTRLVAVWMASAA